jgi:signal transduction histidine kinase
VLIRVRDTGQGIAREHLERVFEPFFQMPDPADQAGGGRRRRPRGTGLGLAICRQIVTLQGGRVWAESDGPGRGSTFLVSLPRAEAGHEAA